MVVFSPRPTVEAPLYDPRSEHDACGVGFVADGHGRPSARVLELALEALAGLGHRGAIAADARTGDGAGVSFPLPRPFVRRVLDELDLPPVDPARVAVGMAFLPAEQIARHAAVQRIECALLAERLPLPAWRRVPVEPGVLGPMAADSRPEVRQPVVVRPQGWSRARFERALFHARRAAEGLTADPTAEPLGDRAAGPLDAPAADTRPGLHLASFSAETIVYKGLVVGPELVAFYPDLTDPAMAVPYAIFHQRYSTNTHPSWRLAQPFRFLAHNGEINTVRGNRAAMRGRAADLGGGALGRRLARDVAAGGELLDPDGSDSASLDEALELLVRGGRHLDEALLTLVPEALALRADPPPGLMAWQAAMADRTEPWDGPAALVFGDGGRVGAVLDRNGLRPAAFEVRRDGIVVLASEAGLLPVEPADLVRRGRLGPGELFVVDVRRGQVLEDSPAKSDVMRRVASARRAPSPVPASAPAATKEPAIPADENAASGTAATTGPGHVRPEPDDAVARRRLSLGLDAERLRLQVRTMATTGREPIWSMGDDTPLAVLGRRPRPAADFLRQSFAQVTNPAIDPERERIVMTLATRLGRRRPLLSRSGPDPLAGLINLDGPILDVETWTAVAAGGGADGRPFRVRTLDTTWPASMGRAGLSRALDRLERDALRAASGRRPVHLLLLDDRAAGRDRLPTPSVLAVGAIHTALARRGLRGRTDIAVAASDALDVHGVATLLAAGAGAVYPWLALELAAELAGSRGTETLTAAAARANIVAALHHGLRKVLARMGLSCLSSYVGAGLVEVVGLSDELAERCFPGSPRFPGAADLDRFAGAALIRRRAAYAVDARPTLPDPGFARYRADGEIHVFAPAAVRAIQTLAASSLPGVGPGAQLATAVEQDETEEALEAYRAALRQAEPVVVRDLLRLRPARRRVPLSRVEPANSIVTRFVSSAMSLGSLSPEAHQALAIGMRRLGGASNTGEGGEDPAWYEPGADGESSESAIKQVASARFGVTAGYLARAEQLEIKIAQGSKPGEGGQLPGAKATAFIAALRRGRQGATMISPPPHHDIYSIEDLAQLIADLRAFNPTARIGVKLVAGAGIGTIAAGVAKAHADYVLVSGHAGGTGASPLSSIKHVGLPWELGLAETHQVLVRQGLRDRVALRVDGGLRTGRDVVVAALLGAEEYGFGTAVLVALGCDMARQCHLDTCPTGIATQRPELRAKFTGTPEQIVAFFLAIAEDVRRELAGLGFPHLEDAVGRTDRLLVGDDEGLALAALAAAPTWLLPPGRRGASPKVRGRLAQGPVASALDERLTVEAVAALADGADAELVAAVTPAERAVGARLSGELSRTAARDGGAPSRRRATYHLRGAAGQSLGAFLAEGLRVVVEGVANDYVAKGLAGGTVVVRPPSGTAFQASRQAIAGNTCLYGATGGRLHLVGRAGMRFAVRNSGAVAVAEGAGAHACEYMTAGTVVLLGEVGANLGAGMTGGRAFVHDPTGRLADRVHPESVTVRRLGEAAAADEVVPVVPDGVARVVPDDVAPSLEDALRALVADHAAEGSARAAALLADWSAARHDFWLVEPRDG